MTALRNTIDVRIMATRKREGIVKAILSQIGMDESVVFYDDAGIGCLPNAMRAWSAPIKEGCTHVMVLQDDIEVVDDFMEICNIAIRTFPRAAIIPFCRYLKPEDRKTDSPYIYMKNKQVSGQCIILTRDDAEKMVQFYETKVKHLKYRHDDGVIGTYLLLNDTPTFSTIPSLVQHICPEDSVIHRSHNFAKNISYVWEGRDVLNRYDWTDKRYSVFSLAHNFYVPEFKNEIREKRKSCMM